MDVPLSTIFPATVMSPPVRLNKIVEALLIVVAVIPRAKVVFAFMLIVVATTSTTVLLKVVVPASTVIDNKELELPIPPVNVFPVPVICKVPSPATAEPLIVELMLTALSPEKITLAIAELSSKVTVVAVNALSKVAVETSAALLAPVIAIIGAVTPLEPVNFAAPAFVMLPIRIISAATVPEKVTTGGAALSDALLFSTRIVDVVALSVILAAIVISSVVTVPVRSNKIVAVVPV